MTARTLADAAHDLARLLDMRESLSNIDPLLERIEEARPEDIVGLPERAFILHFRTEAAKELVVALGLSMSPVCRVHDGEGTQCARIIVLVCSPPRQVARHLQVVGAFANVLARPENVEAMLAIKSPGALISLGFLTGTALPDQLLVRALMTTQPRTVGPDIPLRSAVLEMVRSGLGALPVVDADNRVVGMLSERELLRDVLSRYLPRAGGVAGPQPPSTARRTVADLMTRQVLCVAPDQPLAEVASLMLNKDVDRVPVVKNDRLVGYLTRGDIVRKLIGS